jgi:chemotaxis protein methyltransferase CheR
MIGNDITHQEFERLRRFFEAASGIRLSDSKKVLVCGRLARRLRHFGLDNYRDYLALIESGAEAGERQVAIDLLTTNETHFFREPKHFDLLRQELSERMNNGSRGPLRIWSAASSTGEEAYSLAMTLSEVMGDRPWQVFASDLSTRVLNDARDGIYPKQRADEVPRDLAKRYMLEGFDENEGLFRIDSALRKRVSFEQINLMEPLPNLEPFDMIFLRNVLIYFDNPGKRKIVESVARKLKPSGMLFIGHSETLSGITDVVKPVVPTVYRLP